MEHPVLKLEAVAMHEQKDHPAHRRDRQGMQRS